MTLWFVLALMTAAAMFAVLWPLGRREAEEPAASDVAVYRDQLDEIERDHAAGLIAEADAEAARVEVSRRLLAAADDAERRAASQRSPATWRRRTAALAALVVLPVGAASTYLALGAPQVPGQPIADRSAAPEGRSIEALVAQVESHLERNPEDGRGWDVIAPVYMRLGRFDEAVKARRNALRLNGATAAREADLGEAMVAAANGIVTADAKTVFDRALALEAADPRASYYVGLAAEQDGRREQAADIWRGLLKTAPPGAAWTGVVQQALARVEPAPPNAANPGPRSEDVAAAAELSPDDRATMVRGMVERLAARLASDGSDLEGWMKLVQSYKVLGEPDKARAAAADGRRALAADPAKIERLDAFVKGLGLDG